MKQQFDNHDERIRYYELMLERDLEGFCIFRSRKVTGMYSIRTVTEITGSILKSLRRNLHLMSRD